MSYDVLAISRLFSVVYIRRQNFIHSERDRERDSKSRVEIRVLQKALLCGNCCDRNQPIILVVLVLVSL